MNKVNNNKQREVPMHHHINHKEEIMIKNFLSTVDYPSDDQSNSWSACAEKAAAVCIAPAQWLAKDLFGMQTRYRIDHILSSGCKGNPVSDPKYTGLKKLLRVVAAILLVIPGVLCASALRFFARKDREIELKHQILHRRLTDEENQELFNLVEARKTLANQKQGNDTECLLCCICMLLCCLVCQGRGKR